MTERKPSKWKVLWILPPILLGIGFFLFMKSGKQPPELSSASEPAHAVRITTVKATDFTPFARGYGEVQPAQVWQAVAQVSGRIISVHPRLNNGEIIAGGETLLRIDPVDYELNLVQAQAQLAELEVQQQNTQNSLQIEQRNYELAKKEYQRLSKLVTQGSVSKSAADAAERTMLTSSTQVQNLNNTLALIPTQKKLQQARITQAERDLANTQLIAPFNLRVSALGVELDQFVSTGQAMLSGDSVDRVEVIAQVPIFALKNLFNNRDDGPQDLQSLAGNLSSFTGFKPTVRLDLGGDALAEWSAEFVRFDDQVDPQTRTMGVVVAVDKPLQKIIPGRRPPLSKGMFVEVMIDGRPQPDSIVVPRTALRDGVAYVIDDNSRLALRRVTKKYDQQNHSVIDSGLSVGDRLVLTDVIPAIEGMLLHVVDVADIAPTGG